MVGGLGGSVAAAFALVVFLTLGILTDLVQTDD